MSRASSAKTSRTKTTRAKPSRAKPSRAKTAKAAKTPFYTNQSNIDTTIDSSKTAIPHVRKDDGNAFIPDPGSGPARSTDALAQERGEEFLVGATVGEIATGDALNPGVPETPAERP